MFKKQPRKVFVKQKKKKRQEIICVEPIRKSVYEVLLDNMHFLGRNLFLNRIIYLGIHNFPGVDPNDNVGKQLQRNITYINSQYFEENLTGFLLNYSKYFIVVLDGPEEGIRKHLIRLFSNEKTKDYLFNVKLLAIYHNINQRFLPFWAEIVAKPPQLIQKINPEGDAEEVKNKIQYCIRKLYKFALGLRESEEEAKQEIEEKRTSIVAGSEEPTGRRSSGFRRISTLGTSGSSGTALVQYIPEVQLIDFLIDSPYILDIQTEYMNHYGDMPSLKDYIYKCWPIQTDYIPRNVFEEEFNPVDDIPDPDRVPDESELGLQ